MTSDIASPIDTSLIDIVKVTKTYPPDIMALDDVSMSVGHGEMVFLTGVSGAGKTTLLKLLCFLERPTMGLIEMNKKDISKLSGHDLQKMRQHIGVAYQDFRLLPKQTVYQNIALAMEVRYETPKDIKQRVLELLANLGLADKIHTPTGKLSRGEQQRVSIARACANKPPLILADEPTGNLDPAATALVMNLLKRLNEDGTTIIIATHDQSIYQKSDHRLINLENGKLQEIIKVNFDL
ncbi:MAG: cell division ATP-binding protein FtsE [Proteobacteria bacterium]|nr:cell division ATP-binding protein FtsE [Pseudomonadota bacterium]MBU1639962.1 cell division ATP-binding protein FtsE [Pseudomonadota bacterium]